MINAESPCSSCFGACCIGPQTMQLSQAEKDRLTAAGSILQSIAEPADYDRSDVIYPISFKINPSRRTIQWVMEAANPYEPLPAGYGRYMLFGACGNLKQNTDGTAECGIYDQRPKVCQDFEAGSPKCQRMQEITVPLGKKGI